MAEKQKLPRTAPLVFAFIGYSLVLGYITTEYIINRVRASMEIRRAGVTHCFDSLQNVYLRPVEGLDQINDLDGKLIYGPNLFQEESTWMTTIDNSLYKVNGVEMNVLSEEHSLEKICEP